MKQGGRTAVDQQRDDGDDGVDELLPPLEVEFDAAVAVVLAALKEALSGVDEVEVVAQRRCGEEPVDPCRG